MKSPILNLAMLFLILSCNTDKDRLNGSWLIFYDDLNEESISPMHLEFEGDSLTVSNELFFQIKGSYDLRNDSLHFYPTDLTGYSALIRFEEDEILSLTGKRYHKLDEYSFHLPPAYKLINYPATNLFQNSKEAIIHLVKFKGEAKVILNDALKEIDDVGLFVQNERIPGIAILIGEGVEMKNLVELYSHISNVRPDFQIKLIVKNAIDSFFYLDETLLFCETAHCPPPYPPSPICSYYFEKRDTVANILIESEADFVKIEQIAPDTEFPINLGPELKIQTYFKLKTLLENHPEGRIMFKRPKMPC